MGAAVMTSRLRKLNLALKLGVGRFWDPATGQYPPSSRQQACVEQVLHCSLQPVCKHACYRWLLNCDICQGWDDIAAHELQMAGISLLQHGVTMTAHGGTTQHGTLRLYDALIL